MTFLPSNRRAVTLMALAAATGLVTPGRTQEMRNKAGPDDGLGIDRSAAAIRQEVAFEASPARVYRALTDARLFDRVVALSGARKSLGPAIEPAQISLAAGGAFSLFGGYITGRQIELTPGVRLVQAWRAASWPEHIFSIVRFELASEGQTARLTFDHTGFPSAEAAHLAAGWRENYWEPIRQVLQA
jgi:activator of HSP90 ATPase